MTGRSQSGFSAVELLITLFIAAIFLTGGYQLWIYSQKSGVDSERRGKASNIAYDYLRRSADNQTGNCSTDSTTTPIDSAQLPNASVKIDITCPYGDSSDVTKVTSTVTYGANGDHITHAIFAS